MTTRATAETRTVLVTYDRTRDAREASHALLHDERLPDPVRMQVQTDPLALSGSPFRKTRARAGALLGALAVGSALALIGVVAAMSSTVSMPIALAGLLGGVLGALYGALVGALAGATELTPRLERFRRRLADGKAAVAAEVPADEADDARRALLKHPGADLAM